MTDFALEKKQHLYKGLMLQSINAHTASMNATNWPDRIKYTLLHARYHSQAQAIAATPKEHFFNPEWN